MPAAERRSVVEQKIRPGELFGGSKEAGRKLARFELLPSCGNIAIYSGEIPLRLIEVFGSHGAPPAKRDISGETIGRCRGMDFDRIEDSQRRLRLDQHAAVAAARVAVPEIRDHQKAPCRSEGCTGG